MDKLLNTRTGRVILSVIWGLGIAAIFWKACKKGSCLVMSAPEEAGLPIAGQHCNRMIEPPKDPYRDPLTLTNSGHQLPVQYQDAQEATGPFTTPPAQCGDEPCWNPPMTYYESVGPKYPCDDRLCRSQTCYAGSPMDSIFRKPSDQIYYPYTRN